jgi:threonine/homoserine/homoserine lactone efflux protein
VTPGQDTALTIRNSIAGPAFSAMTLLWLCAYTLVIVRIGHYLKRSGVRRATDVVLGTVLVGLGLRLALERR